MVTKGIVEEMHHFTRDISDYVETVASGATIDIQNRHGGWLVFTLAGDDLDAAMLGAEAVWEVDEGFPLIFEARIEISDVSVSSVFVGMSDANTETGGIVIEDEDGTLNTVPTDAFGFLLEGEQDGTFQAVGVQNDTDNSQVALTSAADPADATAVVLRMEADPNDSGTVRYFVDGKLVATQTSWFRSSILYTPVIACDDRGTAYTLHVDYWMVSAPI